MEDYTLVFESIIPNINYPILSLNILVAVLMLFFLLTWKSDEKFNRIIRNIVIFIVLLTLHDFYSSTKTCLYVKNSLDTKTYKILTGEVEDFNPSKFGGPKVESFTIKGQLFRYMNFDELCPFFHQTKKGGGPIQGNGQKVKIHYMRIEQPKLCIPGISQCIEFNKGDENKILKLYIEKEI